MASADDGPSAGRGRRRPPADPANPESWGLPSEFGRLDTPGLPRMHPVGPHSLVAGGQLATDFPALGRCLGSMETQSQVYLETLPPTPEAKSWSVMSGWGPVAQRAFDRNWFPELDEGVDTLIEDYGSQWHNAFHVVAKVHQPDFVAHLRHMAEEGEIQLTNMYRGDLDITVDLALICGPVRHQMKQRSWPYPTWATCSVCGHRHLFDVVRYWAIRDYGRIGVCFPCRLAASNGPPEGLFDLSNPDAGMEALVALHRATGVIPPQDFRQSIVTIGMDEDTRANVIAALITTPTFDQLRRSVKNAPWISVLQQAGLVGDTWRPSRGMRCLASDGHPCRSLGERTVDDWFTRNQVAHEIEPRYPAHPSLNPNARLRADWLVGQTFVEYAGMMQDKAYAAKMANKQLLARSVGLELIVLVPEDLYQLDRLLAALAKPNRAEAQQEPSHR